MARQEAKRYWSARVEYRPPGSFAPLHEYPIEVGMAGFDDTVKLDNTPVLEAHRPLVEAVKANYMASGDADLMLWAALEFALATDDTSILGGDLLTALDSPPRNDSE